MTACPCDPTVRYAECCGPLHAGTTHAERAEVLMRSRYSAYARADADYLLATWHASSRPPALDLADATATRWLGLEVRRHGLTGLDAAMVEFVARYRQGGAPATRLHEVSRFLRERGRWYYLDGEVLPR